MIQTSDLTYQYNKDKVFHFQDIRVLAGESLLLLGKSGVGKTTLLHLLAGLMKPNNGSIKINDVDICTMSGRTLDHFRGENIGVVFQQNHFISSLSVLENLMLAQSLSGHDLDKERCMDLLHRLNVDQKYNKPIKSLSQGERQRVALARALVNNQKLILADEPTSALDDDNCEEVRILLQEQSANAGAALIIVTHDARLKDAMPNHIILH